MLKTYRLGRLELEVCRDDLSEWGVDLWSHKNNKGIEVSLGSFWFSLWLWA